MCAPTKQSAFDPEGDGYDYETARSAGLGTSIDSEDGQPHWPSREPRTGMVLKGRKHATFDKAIEADSSLGYKLEKRGQRYYTVKE